MTFELTRVEFIHEDSDELQFEEHIGEFETREEGIKKADELRKKQMMDLMDAGAISVRNAYDTFMPEIDDEFEDEKLTKFYKYKVKTICKK